MAGIKAMQPFGEIGFQVEPLLPLQHCPTGIKQGGELGIDFQEIGFFLNVVIKFVDQRTGINIGFDPVLMPDLRLDLNGRGG